MAKTKKEEGPSRRVDGLMLVAVRSPFEQISGSLLDLRGPWTIGLLDAWLEWEDPAQPVGVAVWSGTCEIGEASPTYHRFHFRWEGAWRALSEDEWAALANGDRPLAMTRLPAADELLPYPST